MRKVLLWGGVAAGVAVLGLLAASAFASLSALGTLATPAAAPPPPPPAVAAPAAAPAPPPPSTPAPPVAAAPPPAVAPRPALLPPPPDPAPTTPENEAFLKRANGVNRARADLVRGLAGMRAELAPCFGQGQAAFAGTPVTDAANRDADDPGSPVFALQVSYLNGILRVEEAPVEVRSTASEATLACLQARLKHFEMKTDATPKAQRFRVSYNVAP